MTTIAGLLSVARSALVAEQAAVQTVGQNIANAETPGYSRQQVLLEQSAPARTPQGIFGTGVALINVLRTRDVLLDQAVRDQSAPAAGFQTRSDLLTRVQAVFGEPTDNGLANAIDAFWSSWSDLASNPANSASKVVVQQRGAALAQTLNHYASQLDDISASAHASLPNLLDEANRLTSQIAALNRQIAVAESGGKSANDLRDSRDRFIDQLGTIVPVTVFDRPDGDNQVNVGGMPLVDGPDAKALTLSNGPPVGVTLSGSSTVLRDVGGKLGATMQILNTDIPNTKAALDAIATALITDVNTLHTTGWSPPSGGSGVLFFDSTPANADARHIRLSAAVAADQNAIATGTGLNAPGDNTLALSIAALRDASPTAPSGSLGAAYLALVSTVAGAKNAADDSASAYKVIANQAEQRRQSASGVSTDEELIALMRHQQAYAAAGKLIQAIDVMSQTVLDMIK
jgi:flagellar hook-associated protein 1 FlgK